MRLGALEAGGTKMVCAIGDEHGNVIERASFPTRMPEDTMPDIINYFKDKEIEALGIGSFGPLALDPALPQGQWRELTEEEIRSLYQAARMEE